MIDYQHLERIIQSLPLTLTSEHFVIHYGLRNPMQGRGLGASGVEDRGILLTYIHALERLYQAMTSPPWNRPPPEAGREGKTHIYVFDISELIPGDGSPFAAVTREGIPFVCLPARSFEPSAQSEMLRAAAEAVHETTHLFNAREQALRGAYAGLWYWFDEAIAVFMETHLIPGNHDHFRFLKNWIDIPETPLDDWGARYQAGMFIYYLEKRLPRFANRVWQELCPGEGPIEAIARLLPEATSERTTFLSHDPDCRDWFASGYCLDSYFLSDHTCAALAPELYIRFGGRAITESFVLRPGEQKVSGLNRLNHLACRYFRIYLRDAVTVLRIQIRAMDGKPVAPLKAELAAVNAELRRDALFAPLRPPHSDTTATARQLSTEVSQAEFGAMDHLVLVITNCGTRAAKVNDRIEHDDGRQFEISVSAS